MFEQFLIISKNINPSPIFQIAEMDDKEQLQNLPEQTPVIALKNTVLFPGVVIPITVGRKKSIEALNQAFANGKILAVFSQMDMSNEDPGGQDLYPVGTVAKVIKHMKMPDGSITAILKGMSRVKAKNFTQQDPYLEAEIELYPVSEVKDPIKFEALVSSVKDLAAKIVELSPQIPLEAVNMLNSIKNQQFLLHFIASNLNGTVEVKQEILTLSDPIAKAEQILASIESELKVLTVKDQIDSKVRGDIEKQQRDFYLNQQLKTIQQELGQDPKAEEISKLEKLAKDKKWPEQAAKTFTQTLEKVKRMNPQVADYSIQMNYLQVMLDLPWESYTKDNFDLSKVRKVLDKDHHGLDDVKDRILEHLAVLKLKGDMKAPILCLVGPPGVGKTSLGKSIAGAIERNFIRMSLGGLHDESEIRGHRKTYIGALPGRIIQSIKKAGSSNPVFILDEIDKVGKDFRGDPSSALLEVLDPEQNGSFYDNYLETEYDLSKVMFIATANSLNSIQPALLDRMEIIQLSGYSTEEKIEIAKKHLIPFQRKDHGLKANQVKLNKPVVEKIVSDYTRESGVRSLSRQIAGVMRKVAKKVAMDETYDVQIKPEDLKEILGTAKYSKDEYDVSNVPGVAVGLAWTRVGGDILFIEASLSPGTGKLTLTGNLGDVMKESATTALSFIKANSEQLGIEKEQFQENDIHIHVPQGAIPKDGPSAGITMMTAITSVFRKKVIKPYMAMTGEITLRGKVLPVGGIKEKLLAAKRSGIKEIILSEDNRKHVEEIEERYLDQLSFHYVFDMRDVLKHALGIDSF